MKILIIAVLLLGNLSLPSLLQASEVKINGELPSIGMAVEVIGPFEFETPQPDLYGQVFVWRQIEETDLNQVLVTGGSLEGLVGNRDSGNWGVYLVVEGESDHIQFVRVQRVED